MSIDNSHTSFLLFMTCIGSVSKDSSDESTPIAVLIMACNRVTVTRAIDSVLK